MSNLNIIDRLIVSMHQLLFVVTSHKAFLLGQIHRNRLRLGLCPVAYWEFTV